MIGGLLTRSVIIVRRTLSVRDADGVEEVTFVADAPTPGYVEPTSSSAEVAPGEMVSTGDSLLVLGAQVVPPDPDDRIVVDGERFVVVGHPRKFVRPFGAQLHHWEITIRSAIDDILPET